MGQGHFTQWAAQFAVASELCKRGYEVAFTLGHNTPLADIMAISPNQKKQFLIDVKGMISTGPWLVKRKTMRSDMFYILVLVRKDAGDKFFVLTQEQANAYVDAHMTRPGTINKPRWEGFNFGTAKIHENCWDILPQ